MEDCTKAQALVEWVYWSQTQAVAASTAVRYPIPLDAMASTGAWADHGARRYSMAVPGTHKPLLARLLNQIKAVTCDGMAVSPLAGCIDNGTICSDRGTCFNDSCLVLPHPLQTQWASGASDL
jgi:hypothetical protein